jgi:hypothetical protein
MGHPNFGSPGREKRQILWKREKTGLSGKREKTDSRERETTDLHPFKFGMSGRVDYGS